jgi:hypothetical protein
MKLNVISQILEYTIDSRERSDLEQALQIAEGLLDHLNESIGEQEGQERLKIFFRDLWSGQG